MASELQKLQKDLASLRTKMPMVLKSALSSVQAEMVERIHTDGKDSKGASIGSYSTKPISISKKSQPRATGKTYFSDGYKGFKSSIGFNPNVVNLEVTGQLRQDLSVIPINNKSAGIGFKNRFNNDKSKWAESHFKKEIYKNTKQEIAVLEKVFEFETNKLLKTK